MWPINRHTFDSCVCLDQNLQGTVGSGSISTSLNIACCEGVGGVKVCVIVILSASESIERFYRMTFDYYRENIRHFSAYECVSIIMREFVLFLNKELLYTRFCVKEYNRTKYRRTLSL